MAPHTTPTPPHGVLVPLVTPFAADGRLDTDALAALATAALDAGAAGLVALGTTAESSALDPDERRTVLAVCTHVCRDREATLVVGAGGSDTGGSRAALAALAEHPGVHAALVPVPPFVRAGEAGVLEHFTRLAADSPVPLVVYHVPYRTAQPLGPDTLRALGRLPGVVGVKYSAGGLDQDTVDLLADPPPGFAVLAGDDTCFSPMLALGAAGGILASAQLATGAFVRLVDAWQRHDMALARPLGHALARLSAAAFAEPNPTVIKGVLHHRGLIPTPDVRLPLLPAGPDTVRAALIRLAEVERFDG